MSACPVGSLGRHDLIPAGGDMRKCRWCAYERRWPARKRMPALAISKKAQAHENAAARPQTW